MHNKGIPQKHGNFQVYALQWVRARYQLLRFPCSWCRRDTITSKAVVNGNGFMAFWPYCVLSSLRFIHWLSLLLETITVLFAVPSIHARCNQSVPSLESQSVLAWSLVLPLELMVHLGLFMDIPSASMPWSKPLVYPASGGNIRG